MKKSRQKYSPLFFIVPLALTFFVLYDRSASIFRQLYIQMRYGFSLSVVLISALIFLILCIKKEHLKDLLLFTAILLFFSMSLAGVWASGKSEPMMISGIIPFGDSENYYTDALRWLNGGSFSDYSIRHPFFTTFLITITKIANQNIQKIQVMIMLLIAITAFFSLKSIQKGFNPFTGSLFFTLTFLYSRQYIGCFVSETAGIIFGLLGFSLLIEKYDDLNNWLFYFAIFLITIALVVRAGTFFILPFILLWILKVQKKQKGKWGYVLISLSCMLLTFLLNALFMNHFGKGENIPFSNYVYILYGLARGGTGWTQIMTDHPEIFNLAEIDLTKKIWSLTYPLIIQHPENLISALLKQYVYMFDITQTTKSVFSFANSKTFCIMILVQISLYFLSIVGLISLKKRDKKFSSLIFFSLIGILISVPFVTIQDSFYMRAYAATMPFIILIPCIGLDFITKKKPIGVYQEKKTGKGFLAFVFLILFITFFYPLVVNRGNQFSNLKMLDCEEGTNHVVFSINKNSSIKIYPENVFFLDWAPNFHKSRFYQNIRTYSLSEFVDPLSELDPPFELRVGINLEDYEDVYMIFRGQDFMVDYGIYEFCVIENSYSDSPWMKEIASLFFVKNYQLVKSY